MLKNSGFSSKIKSSLYHTASAIGVIGTGCLATSAFGAATFYTANPTNSSILTVGLAQGSLGNSILSNPSSLTSGTNQFNYTAIMFTATEDGTYKFGQTSAATDTIMILYNGVYDATAPGSGALVGNDDTAEATHQADLGITSAVKCGPNANYCPQIQYTVTAGQTYTLFVSSYNPSYNSSFRLPFDFYSTGTVIFGEYTGRSPIDLARANYGSSELGITIDPTFVGGTLHLDQANAVYVSDFTLANIASSTINQNDQFSRFDGVFSDGTAGKPGYITIDNIGSANKGGMDDGAVIFAGTNTYTGSTTLKGGTLVVSDDVNLGDTVATLVLDGGTLLVTEGFNSSRDLTMASTGTINVVGEKVLSLDGVASGTGSWTKAGAGSIVLSADNTFTGSTTVAEGTLVVGDAAHTGAALSGGGDVNVESGATFGGYGSVTGSVNNKGTLAVGSAVDNSVASAPADFRITGDVTNSGLIQMGGNAAAGDTLTVDGNYVGNNGSLALGSVLEGDTSVTDKLVITGNASGSTQVSIKNLGGGGAKTVDGIEVIDVGGTSTDDAFVQNGRIVAGAYDYNLVKGNKAGTDMQSWFLASTESLRPEAGGYLGLIEQNQGAFNHSFHDRQQLLDNGYESSWARVEYTESKSKAGKDNILSNKTDRTLVHVGSDVFQKDALHLGVMAGYSKGEIKTDSNRSPDTTKSTSDGYSVGVYGTWFDQKKDAGGLYVDGYAQYNWFDNEVKGSTLDAESFNTSGVTVSAEAGYGFVLGKTANMTWTVEPQVQAIYNSYDNKDHTEKNGTRVQTAQSDDFVGRVGVRFQGKSETVQPFVTLNYWSHSDQAGITMDDINVDSNRARNVAELKVGAQVKLNKNVELFGQLQGSTGSDSTSSYGGNVGVKVNW